MHHPVRTVEMSARISADTEEYVTAEFDNTGVSLTRKGPDKHRIHLDREEWTALLAEWARYQRYAADAAKPDPIAAE